MAFGSFLKKPSKSLSIYLLVSSFSVAHAYEHTDFAQVFTPQELRVDQLREQEIQQLALVLSRSTAQEQEPDLLLRLSEIYTERYKLFFMKENEIWSRKMDAYLQLPIEQQKATRRPTLEKTQSKFWLKKSIEILDKIPGQKVQNDRLDEIYYFIGFNRWETGEKKEAARNFKLLVEKFPKSKFAPEGFRYLGDYEFLMRDFTEAKHYYEKSAAFSENPGRPRVFYGLAWCYFKLKNYPMAMNTMREAIQSGRGNSAADRAGLSLQRDADDSLVLFFSEGGDSAKAGGFFSTLYSEEKEVVLVLRKLVAEYQKQGKYARALAVNKQLSGYGGSASKESDDQRFEILGNGLKVASAKSDLTQEAALLKSMVAEFVVSAKKPDPDRVEMLRNQVRKAAMLAHKEGNQSQHSKAAYQQAEELYRLYLSSFGNIAKEDDVAEIHSFLADVYAQTGNYRESAQEYKIILDQAKTVSAYQKYQKQAAEGMVFVLDSMLKGNKKDVSESDRQLEISAIDSYVALYPADKNSPKYLARAAGLLVTNHQWAEAKPRLLNLVEKYPSSQEAWDAAATMLKNSDNSKNYVEASGLAQTFLANLRLMAQDKKGDFRKRLESIASRAQFQQVKQVEDNKNFAEAAKGYEQLATQARDPEVRFKALNNAAVSYGRNGDRRSELLTYQKILENYPEDKNSQTAILGMANDSFLSGRYVEACDIFELYYQMHEKSLEKFKADSQKLAIDALRSAALLRSALNQQEKAEDDFHKLVDASNKGFATAREIAGEFLYEKAKKSRDEGNLVDAARNYQRYGATFGDTALAQQADFELGVTYKKLQEEEKAKQLFQKVIAKVKAKGSRASNEELSVAAQSKLELLSDLATAYANSPLRLPEKQLKQDINARLDAMQQLNKGYEEVIEYGDGTYGIEAFRRIALAYQSFGDRLVLAPVPQEYSEEDKVKFRAQLKKVAEPSFAKTQETLELAVKKGENLQVVGPIMARVYVMAVLGAGKTDRYPLIQEMNWSNASEWIAGQVPQTESELVQQREILKNRPGDANAWIAMGNYHLVRGEEKFAEIFYKNAADKNKKSANAINNMAYLKGRHGEIGQAMAGFKAALLVDEFATQPKKNIARMEMASGLWRHVNLAYRQLEVRSPSDPEVKRGIYLSNLAMGKAGNPVPAEITANSSDKNFRFAAAVLPLVKGEMEAAKSQFSAISSDSEYTGMVSNSLNGRMSR